MAVHARVKVVNVNAAGRWLLGNSQPFSQRIFQLEVDEGGNLGNTTLSLQRTYDASPNVSVDAQWANVRPITNAAALGAIYQITVGAVDFAIAAYGANASTNVNVYWSELR